MLRTRRFQLASLALTVSAALLVASCGVDPGASAPKGPEGSTATTAAPSGRADTTTTTTTVDDDPPSPAEQAAIDTVTDYYEDLGLDTDKAQCLAEAVAGMQGSGEPPSDPSEMMGLFTECDISLEDLTALNEELTEGGTDPMTGAIQRAMDSLGLDEEESACVADAYLDQYGPTDVTSMQDQGVLIGLLDDCGIDLAELNPGD